MDGHYDAPTLVDLPEFAAEVRRYPQITMAEIRGAFDSGFRELAQLSPTGPGYAVYDGDPAGVFDLEIGFPVEAGAGLSPMGRALALTHVGGYDGLPGTWSRLARAAAEAGHEPVGRMVEVYVSDPSVTAEAALRTDLFLLV